MALHDAIVVATQLRHACEKIAQVGHLVADIIGHMQVRQGLACGCGPEPSVFRRMGRGCERETEFASERIDAGIGNYRQPRAVDEFGGFG